MSINSQTVSFIGAGMCVIDANEAGNSSYASAPQKQQSFNVAPSLIPPQTITFTSTAPSNASVGGATYTVTAAGGASGNPVTFTIDASSSEVCSVSNAVVSFTSIGTCVIDANQAGNSTTSLQLNNSSRLQSESATKPLRFLILEQCPLAPLVRSC